MGRHLATRVVLVALACAGLAGCGSSSNEVKDTGGSGSAKPPPPASSTAASAPAQGSTPGSPTSPPAGGSASTTQSGQAGSGGSPTAGPQRCGSIAFAPASSHGAFEIAPIGTSCATAQAVAGAAKDCFGCGYSAAGFSCRGRTIRSGLIRVAYTCTKGSARITFVRG